jgi:myo-inositol-1(or 4)-monophosphatase
MNSSIDISDLRQLHTFACDLTRRAGKWLRDDRERRRTLAAGEGLSTREKMNSVDLVTDADESVEKMIRWVRDHKHEFQCAHSCSR